MNAPCRCLALLGLALAAPLVACGGKPEPREPPPRSPTVFDQLVDKKRSIPAAVEQAQQQHVDDTRRALEAAEAPAPGEGPR